MKGKNLTRNMKKYVSKNLKLDPDEFTYIKNTNELFVLKNKSSGEEISINKIERNIITF